MTATTIKGHATTPCGNCGEPVVIVAVRGGNVRQTVALDPTWPVFLRIAEDPDTEPRGAYWIEDAAPVGEKKQALARHRCARRDDS